MNTELDKLMKDAGMSTVTEILEGSPLEAVLVNPAVQNLDKFGEWLTMRREELLKTKAIILLDNKYKDELQEWVMAQEAAFHEVLLNFKQATK